MLGIGRAGHLNYNLVLYMHGRGAKTNVGSPMKYRIVQSRQKFDK